ncbi:transposase [Streptomyces sp. NPDC051172]|uniref:transposase n=1 Tax=Streptomyces sp. NPDC051172 TaxID=3155796 RepID=UPI003413F0F6
MLPSIPKTGLPPRDRRQVFDGIWWRARTGSPWRDVSERYGPWETVCGVPALADRRHLAPHLEEAAGQCYLGCSGADRQVRQVGPIGPCLTDIWGFVRNVRHVSGGRARRPGRGLPQGPGSPGSSIGVRSPSLPASAGAPGGGVRLVPLPSLRPVELGPGSVRLREGQQRQGGGPGPMPPVGNPELALVLAGVPDSLAQTGGDLHAVINRCRGRRQPGQAGAPRTARCGCCCC